MIVQVNPCLQETDGIARCVVSDADFFGVYVGEPGDFTWVADFATATDALAFAATIKDATIEDNTK